MNDEQEPDPLIYTYINPRTGETVKILKSEVPYFPGYIPVHVYHARVTALISAVDALGGLLDSDLAAVKPWADEIAALTEATRALNA